MKVWFWGITEKTTGGALEKKVFLEIDLAFFKISLKKL